MNRFFAFAALVLVVIVPILLQPSAAKEQEVEEPSPQLFTSPDYSVRREKAAIFSGCETHPATVAPAGSNRRSRGGNESAEAFGVEGRVRRLGEGAGRNE